MHFFDLKRSNVDLAFAPIALLLISLYLPKSFAIYVIPLLLIFILVNAKKNITRYRGIKFLMLSLLAVPFFISLSTEPIESVRLFPLVLMILLFPYKNISIKRLNLSAFICLNYNFLFQIALALHFPPAEVFRAFFYPLADARWTEGNLQLIQEGFRGTRAAGLFYNPNVAAFMSFFPYLIYSKTLEKEFSGPGHIYVILVTIASIYLSGSRTYMIAMAMVIFFNYRGALWIRLLGISLGIFFLSSALREFIFEDFSGDQGSMAVKNEILSDYISVKSVDFLGILRLLFGGEYKIQFDADVGYIIGAWGLTGALAVSFLFALFMAKFRSSIKILPCFLITMAANSLLYGLLTAPLVFCTLVAIAANSGGNNKMVKLRV